MSAPEYGPSMSVSLVAKNVGNKFGDHNGSLFEFRTIAQRVDKLAKCILRSLSKHLDDFIEIIIFTSREKKWMAKLRKLKAYSRS